MSFLDSLLETGGDIFDSVVDGVQSGLEAVGDIANSLGGTSDSIADASDKVDNAVDKVDDAKDTINNSSGSQPKPINWAYVGIGGVVLIGVIYAVTRGK
ncbi:hypothetical protein AAFX60_006945 [Aliivibrio fischeri]